MIAKVGFSPAACAAAQYRNPVQFEHRNQERELNPVTPVYRAPSWTVERAVTNRARIQNTLPAFDRITQTPTHDDIHGTNFGRVAQLNEVLDPAGRMPTPIREGVIATQAALAYGNPFFTRSRIQDEQERNLPFITPVSLN